MEWSPTVFVAMCFDAAYNSRFADVFTPAIQSITVEGTALTPKRVDLSATGDSILTEINDGIAHARLVLADVSSIGRDSVNGRAYRNANVLYEVGIALACRRPQEVILVRDDHDQFLFDVSVIPHATVDFTSPADAVDTVSSLLRARLAEQQVERDARVERAFKALSNEEIYLLKPLSEKPDHTFPVAATSTLRNMPGLLRLLDVGVMQLMGPTSENEPIYGLTPIGRALAARVAREFG